MTAPGGAAAGSSGDIDTVMATFEQLPTILCVLSGPDHVYVAANKALRDFVNSRHILGTPIRDAYPEIQGQQLIETMDRVYETGRSASTPEWRIEVDLDGSGSMGEIFLDMTFSPLRDADGSITGVITQIVDATERVRQRRVDRRRAEEAERRYQAARDVVAELQEALLPTALPVLPGAEVAARYLVAAEDQRAGGDWFDAIPLGDGSVALIVGDIVGHGVAASAAIGQLRAVLNRALIETTDLQLALNWVDRLARDSAVMRAATVCVVVLDPATGAVRYSTCGHPPPLVVAPEGVARYLPLSGGHPLGTGSPLATAEAVLAPGEVVLLYCDGLVERAGQPVQERLQTLATVAGDVVANRAFPLAASHPVTERTAQQCLEIMTRHGYDDDVTVLVAQRRAEPVPPWRDRRPAVPGELAPLRTGLIDWLDLLGASRKDVDAIDLAVSELAANAMEHAYPDGAPGQVWLSAELTPADSSSTATPGTNDAGPRTSRTPSTRDPHGSCTSTAASTSSPPSGSPTGSRSSAAAVSTR